MDTWDADYRDLVIPAHITFGRHRDGQCQFGTVEGWMDYRVVAREGAPTAEFSWQGVSEMDEACGRGWASLIDGKLHGHLFIHDGDDSPFTAERLVIRKARKVFCLRGPR